MNTQDIPKKLMELHTAIIDKTGDALMPPTMLVSATDNRAFRVGFDCGGLGHSSVGAETPDAAIKLVFKFIENLSSEAELQLAEFQKDLAKLIDKGREYSIDLEFVNPLIATSKKLAENAITHEVPE